MDQAEYAEGPVSGPVKFSKSLLRGFSSDRVKGRAQLSERILFENPLFPFVYTQDNGRKVDSVHHDITG